MIDLIQDRKTSKKEEQRHDLLSSLLDANDGEDLGTAKLSTKELFGALFDNLGDAIC
jgi:cytochrome P450